MILALGFLLLLGAVSNAVWAAIGGHTKTSQECAIDAAFGAFVAAWLILQ